MTGQSKGKDDASSHEDHYHHQNEEGIELGLEKQASIPLLASVKMTVKAHYKRTDNYGTRDTQTHTERVEVSIKISLN